jgi:hypothetical protein
MSSPVQKGKGEEANLDCPVSRLLSRQHVNPRAASGGDAWRGRTTTVYTGLEGFPALL